MLELVDVLLIALIELFVLIVVSLLMIRFVNKHVIPSWIAWFQENAGSLIGGATQSMSPKQMLGVAFNEFVQRGGLAAVMDAGISKLKQWIGGGRSG